MLADLSNAPHGSCVLLHACAHNPTGVDPSHAQWKKIVDLVRERHLLALMDTAYLGFASGDLNADRYSMRLFLDQKVNFIACQSYAKNFGL